jgi:hypothetical protein
LRHKTLRITLETYVYWWPKRDHSRGVVGAALRSAASAHDLGDLEDQVRAGGMWRRGDLNP